MRTNSLLKMKSISSAIFRMEAFLLVCLFGGFCHGQDTRENDEYAIVSQDTIILEIGIDDDFFGSEDPMQITLAFDIRGFKRTKDNPEYYDATITINTSNDDSIRENIRLKARGEMRRAYCDLPPIMLNLKSIDGSFAGLENPGKLKLVTYCKESGLYEQYVLREYLAYKLYNIITPYSLKVRLVQVKYVDINRPDNAHIAYGFIIEDFDDMAKRNEAVIVENEILDQKNMVPERMVRLALFNYMIGNTDWVVSSQHNIRILKPTQINADDRIPVPYDFDYSGFVGTNYAVPAKGIPINSVYQRYYLGICVSDDLLIKVIDELGALEDKIMEKIDNFQYLSKASSKQAQSYLEKYYKMYNKKNKLIRSIHYTCKQ